MLLAIHYAREIMLVDRCLDSGGSFDYVRMSCDLEANHPYVSHGERNIITMTAALAALLVAGAYLVIERVNRRL